MAQQVFGPAAVVSVLNRAFTNTSPSNAVFANQVATAGTTEASQLAFAKSFGASFATGKTAADLSALLMTNMGITNAALSAALTDYIAANGTQNVGIIAWQLSSILSNLESDGTYGAAAQAWNAEVTAAYEYSANPKNTTPSTGTTTGNEAGTSTVLTTAQDVVTGGVGNDFFRGVAGQPVGNQEQSTFNSSDIIDGGAGVDTLILNLVGNYNGGARVKNVETLQLGVNAAIAAAFDYNVNAGFNEISEVTKVTADQINAGEFLTVNNVVRATAADGARTMPTISWVNDNATTAAGQAGVVNFNYRAAELIGAADTQNVELQSVSNGQLNVSAGVETINLKSLGTERVTLQVSANADAAPNNVGADLISTGTLTKVVLSGTAEIGKAGGIQAVTGLTDRVVGADTGITGVPLTTAATASNLLSVDARVTEVDASAATAAVNVRFLAKTTGAETNVTFKGGAGNDYAEFEVGNITATGGAGDDTFAFINNSFNSTLTTADSIDGGAGTDSIQLGLNGVGNYDLQWTEFNSKTGVDVLDLRGAANKVELSDAFVAAADAGLTVRTDKIVQTSAASVANPAGGSVAEDASVNTILLTKLAANRAITFEGGSGSDRLVLNEQSFTSNATLRGGDNWNNAGPAVLAAPGDYDTLTVVDNAVLSRGDLSKTSGFEGLVLVKSDNMSNRQFSVELTEAFVLANTLATNNATTTNIDDTVFQIGTSSAANANALGAGDTVTVDITDLFSAGVYKTTLAGRGLDLTTLTAAGVTVNYLFNGAAATAGQIAAVTKVDAVGQNDVVVASAAVPGAAPLFFNGTVADETVTLVANGNSVNMAGGADTVNTGAALAPTGNLDGGAGADTLNAATGVNLAGATISNFETLNLNGAATLNAAQYAAFTTVTGAGGADAVTLTTAGNVNGFAAVETYNLSAAGNQITLAGATAQTINGGAGADTVVTTGANLANKTIALAGGADVLTISGMSAAGFTLAAAGAAGAAVTGVETVNFQAGLIGGAGTFTMFNGAATVNLTSTAGDTAATDTLILGTGGQTVNVTAAAATGYNIRLNTGSDSVNLTAAAGSANVIDAATVAGSSLVTNFTTITGFRAGVDQIDSAVAGGANQLTTLNVNASVSLADLAGTLNNAVAQAITLAAANWNAAGDAVIVNISAGTAAGTYVVQNAVADATFDAAAELVVKLVGTVGVITQADII